jgi:hypothetical protein
MIRDKKEVSREDEIKSKQKIFVDEEDSVSNLSI